MVCGLGKCGDPDLIPTPMFLNFTTSIGMMQNAGCCVRRCRNDSRCKLNEVGCVRDSDCQDKLFCNTTGAEGFCSDVNECTDPRYAGIVANYCMLGMTTRCVDTIGSFSCECLPGFTDFVTYFGCTGLYFNLQSQETGMYLGMNLHPWTNTQWAATSGYRPTTKCGLQYKQANGAPGHCTLRNYGCCSSRTSGSCSDYYCQYGYLNFRQAWQMIRYEASMMAKCGAAIEWRWRGNMLQNRQTEQFLQVVEDVTPEVLTVTSTGSSATQLGPYMGGYRKQGSRNGQPYWMRTPKSTAKYIYFDSNNTWVIGTSSTTDEGVALKAVSQGGDVHSTGWLALEPGPVGTSKWSVDPDLVVLGRCSPQPPQPRRLLHPAGSILWQGHLQLGRGGGRWAGGVRRAVCRPPGVFGLGGAKA